MDISTGNIKRAKFAEALSRNGNYPLKEAFIALEENGDNLIEAAKALVRKFGAPSTPVQPKSPRDQSKHHGSTSNSIPEPKSTKPHEIITPVASHSLSSTSASENIPNESASTIPRSVTSICSDSLHTPTPQDESLSGFLAKKLNQSDDLITYQSNVDVAKSLGDNCNSTETSTIDSSKLTLAEVEIPESSVPAIHKASRVASNNDKQSMDFAELEKLWAADTQRRARRKNMQESEMDASIDGALNSSSIGVSDLLDKVAAEQLVTTFQDLLNIVNDMENMRILNSSSQEIKERSRKVISKKEPDASSDSEAGMEEDSPDADENNAIEAQGCCSEPPRSSKPTSPSSYYSRILLLLRQVSSLLSSCLGPLPTIGLPPPVVPAAATAVSLVPLTLSLDFLNALRKIINAGVDIPSLLPTESQCKSTRGSATFLAEEAYYNTQTSIAMCALESSLIAMSIMISPNIDASLFQDDVVDDIVSLTRKLTSVNVLPCYDILHPNWSLPNSVSIGSIVSRTRSNPLLNASKIDDDVDTESIVPENRKIVADQSAKASSDEKIDIGKIQRGKRAHAPSRKALEASETETLLGSEPGQPMNDSRELNLVNDGDEYSDSLDEMASSDEEAPLVNPRAKTMKKETLKKKPNLQKEASSIGPVSVSKAMVALGMRRTQPLLVTLSILLEKIAYLVLEKQIDTFRATSFFSIALDLIMHVSCVDVLHASTSIGGRGRSGKVHTVQSSNSLGSGIEINVQLSAISVIQSVFLKFPHLQVSMVQQLALMHATSASSKYYRRTFVLPSSLPQLQLAKNSLDPASEGTIASSSDKYPSHPLGAELQQLHKCVHPFIALILHLLHTVAETPTKDEVNLIRKSQSTKAENPVDEELPKTATPAPKKSTARKTKRRGKQTSPQKDEVDETLGESESPEKSVVPSETTNVESKDSENVNSKGYNRPLQLCRLYVQCLFSWVDRKLSGADATAQFSNNAVLDQKSLYSMRTSDEDDARWVLPRISEDLLAILGEPLWPASENMLFCIVSLLLQTVSTVQTRSALANTGVVPPQTSSEALVLIAISTLSNILSHVQDFRMRAEKFPFSLRDSDHKKTNDSGDSASGHNVMKGHSESKSVESGEEAGKVTEIIHRPTKDTIVCPCDFGLVPGAFVISCDSCNLWFHGVCQNIPEDDPPLWWHCDACRLEQQIEIQRQSVVEYSKQLQTPQVADKPAPTRTKGRGKKTSRVADPVEQQAQSDDSLPELTNSLIEEDIVLQQLLLNYISSQSHGDCFSRMGRRFILARLSAEALRSRNAVLAQYYVDQWYLAPKTWNEQQKKPILSPQNLSRLTFKYFLESKVSKAFERALILFLRCSDAPQSKIRAQVLRGLTNITQVEPLLMVSGPVASVINSLFNDESKQVRAGILDLLGNYINLSPEKFVPRYYKLLLQSLADPSVAVRKKIISIFKEILSSGMFQIATDSMSQGSVRSSASDHSIRAKGTRLSEYVLLPRDVTLLVQILQGILERIADRNEESSIKELCVQIFQDLWFQEPTRQLLIDKYSSGIGASLLPAGSVSTYLRTVEPEKSISSRTGTVREKAVPNRSLSAFQHSESDAQSFPMFYYGFSSIFGDDRNLLNQIAYLDTKVRVSQICSLVSSSEKEEVESTMILDMLKSILRNVSEEDASDELVLSSKDKLIASGSAESRLDGPHILCKGMIEVLIHSLSDLKEKQPILLDALFHGRSLKKQLIGYRQNTVMDVTDDSNNVDRLLAQSEDAKAIENILYTTFASIDERISAVSCAQKRYEEETVAIIQTLRMFSYCRPTLMAKYLAFLAPRLKGEPLLSAASNSRCLTYLAQIFETCLPIASNLPMEVLHNIETDLLYLSTQSDEPKVMHAAAAALGVLVTVCTHDTSLICEYISTAVQKLETIRDKARERMLKTAQETAFRTNKPIPNALTTEQEESLWIYEIRHTVPVNSTLKTPKFDSDSESDSEDDGHAVVDNQNRGKAKHSLLLDEPEKPCSHLEQALGATVEKPNPVHKFVVRSLLAIGLLNKYCDLDNHKGQCIRNPTEDAAEVELAPEVMDEDDEEYLLEGRKSGTVVGIDGAHSSNMRTYKGRREGKKGIAKETVQLLGRGEYIPRSQEILRCYATAAIRVSMHLRASLLKIQSALVFAYNNALHDSSGKRQSAKKKGALAGDLTDDEDTEAPPVQYVSPSRNPLVERIEGQKQTTTSVFLDGMLPLAVHSLRAIGFLYCRAPYYLLQENCVSLFHTCLRLPIAELREASLCSLIHFLELHEERQIVSMALETRAIMDQKRAIMLLEAGMKPPEDLLTSAGGRVLQAVLLRHVPIQQKPVEKQAGNAQTSDQKENGKDSSAGTTSRDLYSWIPPHLRDSLNAALGKTTVTGVSASGQALTGNRAVMAMGDADRGISIVRGVLQLLYPHISANLHFEPEEMEKSAGFVDITCGLRVRHASVMLMSLIEKKGVKSSDESLARIFPSLGDAPIVADKVLETLCAIGEKYPSRLEAQLNRGVLSTYMFQMAVNGKASAIYDDSKNEAYMKYKSKYSAATPNSSSIASSALEQAITLGAGHVLHITSSSNSTNLESPWKDTSSKQGEGLLVATSSKPKSLRIIMGNAYRTCIARVPGDEGKGPVRSRLQFLSSVVRAIIPDMIPGLYSLTSGVASVSPNSDPVNSSKKRRLDEPSLSRFVQRGSETEKGGSARDSSNPSAINAGMGPSAPANGANRAASSSVAATSETVNIRQVRYLIETLLLLPYEREEDILTIAFHTNRVASLFAETMVSTLRQTAEQLKEENGEGMTSGLYKDATAALQPGSESPRDRGGALRSAARKKNLFVVLCYAHALTDLLRVKETLKQTYGVSDARVAGYDPSDVAKNRATDRQVAANWDSLLTFYAQFSEIPQELLHYCDNIDSVAQQFDITTEAIVRIADLLENTVLDTLSDFSDALTTTSFSGRKHTASRRKSVGIAAASTVRKKKSAGSNSKPKAAKRRRKISDEYDEDDEDDFFGSDDDSAISTTSASSGGFSIASRISSSDYSETSSDLSLSNSSTDRSSSSSEYAGVSRSRSRRASAILHRPNYAQMDAEDDDFVDFTEQ